jgi:glucose-6-phosphate isomerase
MQIAMETNLWQRYQDWLYYHDSLELYLDISRMRFDEELLSSLKPKFDKAFQDLADLETGAIANPDERRMVGHYWLRTPELAPTEEIRQAIVKDITPIETFANQIHRGEIHPP